MRIKVETLGSVTVSVDGRPAASLLTRPVRSAAFLWLVLEPHPTREALIGLFWSDRDPEKARRACIQTLYQLRLDLGGEWLVTVGNRLEVRAEIDTDLAAFERALGEGRTADALTLYRGPFLHDLGNLGGVEFEHWAERIRARLEREHRKARRAAIAAALEQGDLNGALLHTRRWVDIEPFDDEANHQRIALLAQSGARDDALRWWSLYQERLRHELGAEPMDETVRLVESIRAGTHGPSEPALRILEYRPLPGMGTGSAEADAALEPAPAVRRDPGARRLGLVAATLMLLLLVASQPWGRPQSATVIAPAELDPGIIAILPFANAAGDAELESVAHGLREALALELQGNGRLTVISNPAVRQAVEAGMSDDSIARRYHAGTTISGQIQRIHGSVRFYLGVTDRREVGESYLTARVERPDSQVHLLESDLMAAVAGLLREHLGRRIELARTQPPDVRNDAYTAYQGGRRRFQDARSRVRADAPVSARLRLLAQADSLLSLAAERAPNWTAPVLLRGWAQREMARVSGTRDTTTYKAYMEGALAFADTVLRGDPQHAEALELRGATRMHLGIVLPDTELLRLAEQDLEASLESEPRPSTRRFLSFLHLRKGDVESAERFASRALEMDPFDMDAPDLIASLVYAQRSAGNAEDAGEWCRRGQREHPEDYRFTDCVLANAAVLGKPEITADSAARLLETAERLDPQPRDGDPSYRPYYRQVLYATTLLRDPPARDSARRVVSRAVKRATEKDLEKWLDYDLAWFELLSGDTMRAEELWLRYINRNPVFREFALNDARWPGWFAGRARAAR